MENDSWKIWDVAVETDNLIETKRPDMGVMSRPAGGAAAFTEHRQSKSPDLWKL